MLYEVITLIAFASLFPIMSVMGYAMILTWIQRRRAERASDGIV